MNKEERKKLIQSYKENELEKELDSDNKIIANFARLQLGLSTATITESDILETNGYHLLELIYYKIEESAVKRYKSNPNKFKNFNAVLKAYPFHLQFIYYSHQFEMSVTIGDCDKIIDSSPIEEIELIAKGYNMIGFPNLGNHLLDVYKGEVEVEVIEEEFKVFCKSIDKEKIDYIKKNVQMFQI